MIDGTIVRAHQHAAGARGGQEHQALARSSGGFSTKIHVKVDAFGLPLAYIITGGNRQEITQAKELLKEECCDKVVADRGYDSDDFREHLENLGIEPVIPGKKNRKVSIDFDRHVYKERNFVERFFNKIKGFRRIATRYDKTAKMYLGALLVVGILLWLQI